MPLRLEVAALTDVGCVRQNNEDCFGYDEANHLYVVCDGMGGMAAGEVASNAAVARMIEAFRPDGNSTSGATAEERLYQSILETNRAVRAMAASNPALDGMGTTLVAACLESNRMVIGNVGDSRAYFLRDGQCLQITQDHSFLAEQIRNGTMTPETAASSPFQSAITRAIGIADTVEPDFFGAELQPGDMVLLTTDGLTRYAEADRIASLIGSSSDLNHACQSLIAQAKEGGAVDNVTCLLLRAIEA